jgi:putative DNA primase/helicase
MNTPDVAAAALSVLREAGLLVDSIVFDGQLHRVPVDDKPRGKDGAYIAYADTPASAWWQNWRSGEAGTWTAKGQDKLTPAEREALARRMEENRRQREEEQARVHAEAATKAQAIYAAAADCPGHPYLERKGVRAAPGLKCHKGAVVVPLCGEGGKIASLQFIGADGAKRFLTGGRKKGCYFSIDGKDAGKPLLIAEGYATAASLHECLELPVLVAFDAGNLLPVATMARAKYPEREIILAADNDIGTDGNPGLTKATAAALAVGGSLAVPRHEGRACDWNDLYRLMGAGEVRTQFMPTKPTGPMESALETGEAEQNESRILPPPPPVPLEAFPAPVAAILEEAAEAFTVPIQIPAACLLGVLSCLVGGTRLISLRPSWKEPGNSISKLKLR